MLEKALRRGPSLMAAAVEHIARSTNTERIVLLLHIMLVHVLLP
jgi:hypothetical protein